MKLLGLCGSLRKASYNAALLRTAAALMPAGATLDLAGIHGIPLYDGDLESEVGIPEPVASLKSRIAGSLGVLIATPEYNNSIPGVLKNAIDWASRPPDDIERVFGGKPVALIGASPGYFGTILAQTAWLPVFRTLGMELWTGARLIIPRAPALFSDGTLVDQDMRDQLAAFLAGFLSFARKTSSRA